MIRSISIALLLLLTAVSDGLAQREDLTVMSFNIRYAHTTPPNLWPDRQPVVRQVIVESGADIVGTQEGLYPQLRDMDEDLPDFEWIGVGREGGTHGEFMAIFYRPIRFEPLEYDSFWLSDTPQTIGSSSWGNEIPRMVTWVRFLDRLTEQEFYLVNTHFDHQSQPSRERSAALLLERIEGFDPELPVIVTGDFNAEAPANPAHGLLTTPEALSDTWVETHEAEPEIGTFHGFEGVDAAAGGARIDWILTRGGVETIASEIITTEVDGQYPSDHFPVTATLRFR